MKTIYISQDSVAVALGADALAQLGAEIDGMTVKRTSSRGLFWAEPLVELDTAAGRLGFANVRPEELGALVQQGDQHPKCIGLLAEHPYLKDQTRLCFGRMGVTQPLDLDDYRAHGGFAGLDAARTMTAEQVAQAVLDSGLRGRGGAGFPAGLKWQTVAKASAAQKYIVCNADEGDSGTFADRMVLEGDPFMLIEGMLIAALAAGASKGYVYIRSEYPKAFAVFSQAVALATEAGYLAAHSADNAGSSEGAAAEPGFSIEVRLAAGSYVCGEETAMLESIEGKRGIVRAKPPIPALSGLFGAPTVINNVITLASVPAILARGAAHYAALGSGRSKGTLPVQLAGNILRGGLVEVPFGAVSLRDLVFTYGGGTRSGLPVKAIQVGGPLGPYVPESLWDLPWDIDEYAKNGITIGHGGIVVHDSKADMAQLARYAFEFCAIESCGKCTPCRIGSTRGVEVVDRLLAAQDAQSYQEQESLLRDLCDTMVHGSLCAMGSMTPLPVLSALQHYPTDFTASANSAKTGV